VFNGYVRDGRIEETALITVDNQENVHRAIWKELGALLPGIPLWSVDALWVPHETIAAGCAEALASAGRQDIKLVSVGISNEVLHLMQRHPGIWLASAAVDPGIAGAVNMRMLAARLADEAVPKDFYFTPQMVKAADLNAAVNLANIRFMVPGWGDERGLLDHYQWMTDLKGAEGKYLRIPQAVQ
jgi:simple sugar transport system substrate-binding protein